MSVPARAISPEALEEARRLYERTGVPVQQVADLLGISKSTLNIRRRLWGWKPRMARIPLAGPADISPTDLATSGMAPAGVVTEAKPVDAAPPTERRELIARLVRRIETEIAAIERLVGLAGLHAATNPQAGPADGERAARTLAILVRSLRELAALEKLEPDRNDDDATRDADAFRRELGQTLERVLAGGEAG
ncbi:hypothetical protein [Ancylobacter sp.]|uniref:hypothetical protein n=1 Tax=Ancylobacter sp. TaxID=1872567 RepID=UPI003D0A4451